MAPLSEVKAANALTDGFSVDNNVLHWRSSKFKDLPEVGSIIMKNQGGEAQWGLFTSKFTGGQMKLYSQLGCPGGDHGGMHEMLWVGSNKVVPL